MRADQGIRDHAGWPLQIKLDQGIIMAVARRVNWRPAGSDPMAVPVELSRILIRETEDSHIVELKEVGGGRYFPIVIGLNEAAAIKRRLMNDDPPRPQTHELLANIIEELGATVEKVVISDIREHTFFARLHLMRDGEVMDIDARPSDAIAIGVAVEVPMFVEERVFEAISEDG